MQLQTPKPDFGMNPWILTMLIMFTVVIQAMFTIILFVLIFYAAAVVWAFSAAYLEVRRERQLLKELGHGRG